MSGPGRVDFSFDKLRDDLPPVPPLEQFIEGLPDFKVEFTGYWNDMEPTLTIRSVGPARKGGNQHARWLGFDAEITGPDGESQGVKRVRMRLPG